jgi:hypothetical protein
VAESPSQAALERMLEWVDQWAAELRAAAEHPVLGLTFERSRTTFTAAVMLTGRDYGPQAAMLARSLFEDMLLAFWMSWCLPADRVEARLDAQRRHRQFLADLTLGEDFDEATRDLCNALFGAHGQSSWWARSVVTVVDPDTKQSSYKVETRRTLATLIGDVRTVAERLADSAPSKQREDIAKVPAHLQYLLRQVNGFNNDLLHHSAVGLSALDEQIAPKTTFMIRTALYMTFDMLIFLLSRGHVTIEADYLYVRPRFDPWHAEGIPPDPAAS